eukprot:TRINITY_DN2602_c0_g1_i1.p1 TRINITY_DN2602_c0_g1~~TRINITY_DN2602_c0_g1_i1.p1  ORF type:complete len:215 (-),score=48.32 TRINITY_DN2602_c0_g1_i1:252-896(-)
MGNICASLGIKQGRPITRNDFGAMWLAYEDEQGRLSSSAALKFLQDLASAANVQYDQNLAKTLVDSVCQDRGSLDYSEFQRLFFSVSRSSYSLSLSLEEELSGLASQSANRDLDDLWAELEILLNSFFSSSTSKSTLEEWMSVYTAVYSYCNGSQNDVIGLYKLLGHYLARRAKSVSQKEASIGPDGDLIGAYLTDWATYERAAQKNRAHVEGT